MPHKALISGGGIAGPALAFWLVRLGYHCTIIERSPELRTGGQQIDIKAQAVEVVKHMGLLDEVRKNTVDETGLRFVNSDGTTKAFFAKEEDVQGRGISSEFEIMRGDLCRILYNATRNNCEYRFGIAVKNFSEENGQVKVTMSDGSEDTFDLLVAADGQESRIRKTMIGEETDKSSRHSLNIAGCYYHVERENAGQQLASAYIAPQRRLITTRWHTPKNGQAYLFTMGRLDRIREALHEDTNSQKRAFAEVFQDSGWESDWLIDSMWKADNFYAQDITQIRCPTWSKGRVVLLGDAGYAPTPLTGMGTSLALIGAYVLAGELSRHKHDIPRALESYEKAFRPFVEETQSLPPGIPSILYPETNWGIKLIYTLLGFASWVKLNRLVAQLADRDSKHKWQLPPPAEFEVDCDGEVRALV